MVTSDWADRSGQPPTLLHQPAKFPELRGENPNTLPKFSFSWHSMCETKGSLYFADEAQQGFGINYLLYRQTTQYSTYTTRVPYWGIKTFYRHLGRCLEVHKTGTAICHYCRQHQDINSLSKACQPYLQNLSQLRPLLTLTARILAQIIILSHLHYCPGLLTGLSASTLALPYSSNLPNSTSQRTNYNLLCYLKCSKGYRLHFE